MDAPTPPPPTPRAGVHVPHKFEDLPESLIRRTLRADPESPNLAFALAQTSKRCAYRPSFSIGFVAVY
jgi:hypothetical protein